MEFMLKRNKPVYNPIMVLITLFALCSAAEIDAQNSFRENQMNYQRVRVAYDECYSTLERQLAEEGTDIQNMEILLRAFKQEQKLEVWTRSKGTGPLVKSFTYDICRLSGGLGPKRQEGDLQVPEGFYYITLFNPRSNFFLSLGTNYPNRSDRIIGNQESPGSEIFIHGSCVTIGCIPITDRYIKELYVLCVEARNSGQRKIPIYIYPAMLRQGKLAMLIEEYHPTESTEKLWLDLEKSYQLFEESREIQQITFLSDGTHRIR